MEWDATPANLPGIVEATESYEQWLGEQVPLWTDDLDYKHEMMASAPFPFLRATFYRWCQRWPRLCPDEAKAPQLLAVGDLHVENFGTWRDSEGRLVWGVNDFDEVTNMPYTIDLVRLATSARLALKGGHLSTTTSEACAAILAGYGESLENGGHALVLAEKDKWLRRLATGKLRDPVLFWARMTSLRPLDTPLRPALRNSLLASLPAGMEEYDLRRRRAGLGSLGRERVMAEGMWKGAHVAREVKSAVRSAWTRGGEHETETATAERLLLNAVRDPDPCYVPEPTHVVRRLGPDCSRIELSDLPDREDHERLLRAMGWETANIHLAHPDAAALILADLKARPDGWLDEGARKMARAVYRDWKDWRSAWKKGTAARKAAAS
ncbi:MAG TPA: DUF2252 family protein [Candidatus Dormibacteraeota bacterium]|nr:DUF2252 family protein [Candidatus Dormibacteraeota bacterium]